MIAALLLLLACRVAIAADVAPAGPYGPLAESLGRFIDDQIRAKGIPAASIALVDDQRIIWSRGFGQADPARGTPADADTIHRVGSVSKLFTDIAVMQLVERGVLDLDAPITAYLPDFKPENPFDKPITLRQLMSHRSGLVREPPVGHYFDPTRPSLAETVASLNKTTLIYEPTTRTKYSNAAIAAVGYVVERTQGTPFDRHVADAVLKPIGMESSGFDLSPERQSKLASAIMWTYDRRVFPAPTFPMGIGPAGNLYASANDLGRFLSVLFADGRGPGGPVLKPETLRSMYEVQFAGTPRNPQGYGLGFSVSAIGRLDKEGAQDPRRTVGHGGAVYGFATQLLALPEEKLGVAVIATKDCANGVCQAIAEAALKGMLDVRDGRPPAELKTAEPIGPDLARRLAGHYVNGPYDSPLAGRSVGQPDMDFTASFGTLRLVSGSPRPEVRRLGDRLVYDDEFYVNQPAFEPVGDGFTIGAGVPFMRAPAAQPDPSPRRFADLIGEYGWDHDVLYIYERNGRLRALIEWFFDYPLDVGPDGAFRFPPWSMYNNEPISFPRGDGGRVVAADVGGVIFPRRRVGPEDGSTFKITPVRPVAALRLEALKAEPPREGGDLRAPELVDLGALDPTLKFDIRYATDDNFAGTPFYSSARAFLQKPAAEALLKVHRTLGELGFGLLIHDAYRPWHVTKMFWDATPEVSRKFVADPARGSKHNRGCAVDLTLYDRATGAVVPMVGVYDEFSDRSNPDYPGGTGRQRWHRDLLRRVMEQNGFAVNEAEWWHFDYRDWPKYPILNEPFERLSP